MNGSAHGRESLAAKRERYESEGGAMNDPRLGQRHPGTVHKNTEKAAPRNRPQTGRVKD
jgi:hypothetical protein